MALVSDGRARCALSTCRASTAHSASRAVASSTAADRAVVSPARATHLADSDADVATRLCTMVIATYWKVLLISRNNLSIEGLN